MSHVRWHRGSRLALPMLDVVHSPKAVGPFSSIVRPIARPERRDRRHPCAAECSRTRRFGALPGASLTLRVPCRLEVGLQARRPTHDPQRTLRPRPLLRSARWRHPLNRSPDDNRTNRRTTVMAPIPASAITMTAPHHGSDAAVPAVASPTLPPRRTALTIEPPSCGAGEQIRCRGSCSIRSIPDASAFVAERRTRCQRTPRGE